MKIHDKIRFMRMEKGWSQEIMAEKLDMAIATYSNIERGITDIQASRLEQIADVFNISLVDLLSLGEKSITCLAGDNNHHIQNLIFSQEATALELQKMQFLVEQQTKEITYLKEIIDLMKNK